MIPLEKLKEILDEKQLPEEQKKQMIEFVQPFYEFNAYIRNKLNITEEEVEKLTREYSAKHMKQYEEHLNEVKKDPEKSVIQESILLTAKVFGDFAREHDYDKSKELETSFAAYLEIMMLEQITSQQQKQKNN